MNRVFLQIDHEVYVMCLHALRHHLTHISSNLNRPKANSSPAAMAQLMPTDTANSFELCPIRKGVAQTARAEVALRRKFKSKSITSVSVPVLRLWLERKQHAAVA